jgi:hypothetical protein
MIQARATKLNGKNPWRVTDAKGRPLCTRDGKALDRGGYEKASLANQHATAINRANALTAVAAAKKPTKRQRVESRRAVKLAQRERVEQAALAKRPMADTQAGAA